MSGRIQSDDSGARFARLSDRFALLSAAGGGVTLLHAWVEWPPGDTDPPPVYRHRELFVAGADVTADTAVRSLLFGGPDLDAARRHAAACRATFEQAGRELTL